MDVAPDRVHTLQTMDKVRTDLWTDTIGDLFNQEGAQEIGSKLKQMVEVEHVPMMALVEKTGKTGKCGCAAWGRGSRIFPSFLFSIWEISWKYKSIDQLPNLAASL